MSSCVRVQSRPGQYDIVPQATQPTLRPCPDCIRIATWQHLLSEEGDEVDRDPMHTASTSEEEAAAGSLLRDASGPAVLWSTKRTARGIRRPRLFASLTSR